MLPIFLECTDGSPGRNTEDQDRILQAPLDASNSPGAAVRRLPSPSALGCRSEQPGTGAPHQWVTADH